jgi:hypothetical protein
MKGCTVASIVHGREIKEAFHPNILPVAAELRFGKHLFGKEI